MHLVYYITNHGYGHGVRTAAICNAFMPQVRITFRTTLPRQFFEEEIHRDFSYTPARFDCGCLQSDSLTTDPEKTAACYGELACENGLRLAAEAQWLRDHKTDVVVSDIVPFAFAAASAAGIPSVAVTNFTWYDVYAQSLSHIPGFAPVLEEMRRQYELADLLLALEPALPMDYFRERLDTPPVGRYGSNRRAELVARYNMVPSKKIGLIYFGHFGLHGMDWTALERFLHWEFIGLCPLSPAPKNYRVIEKTDFPYQDLVASVDLMIAKIGYCVVSESMLAGTPLLYVPRDDFAESPKLEAGVAAWGGGYRMTFDTFKTFDLMELLTHIERTPRPPAVPQNGATMCARAIERLGGGV